MTSAITLSRPSSLRATGAHVIAFAIALALASQVAIPLPGTPVPITLQPFIVVLAGLWLGPVAGVSSMLLYLAAGALGVPVFSPFGAPGIARFFGPTGGYLLAYPVSAFVAGWLGDRARSLTTRTLAAMAGSVVLLAGGLLQLALLQGSVRAALAFGVTPFIVLDFIKAALAAMIAPRRTDRSAA